METGHRWFTVLRIGLWGVWTFPITYRHATRKDPREVAMTCGTLDVCQGKRHAKIKMHIVLALGLTCERLMIYTAFVKLCNKHEE